MPRGDRMGPEGMGPGTGRGAGFCNGFDRPGFMNPSPGYGAGNGFRRGFHRERFVHQGMGFGRRIHYRRPYADAYVYGDPGDDLDYGVGKEFLEKEIIQLKKHLEALEKQLSNVNNKEGKE